MSFLCEFCSSGKGTELYKVYLIKESSILYRCSSCDSCQIYPLFPESLFLKYYQNMYFNRSIWQIRKAKKLSLDYLKKIFLDKKYLDTIRGLALEVGGSYGFFSNAFNNNFINKIELVEPSKECQTYINYNFPNIKTFNTIDKLINNKKYDIIFCFHVIEHLQKLSPFLQKLSMLLNKGGRIYSLTPNASSTKYKIFGEFWGWSAPKEHYQFLSQNIRESYFLKNNLRIVYCQDTSPAAIHYPSWIHSEVKYILARINNKYKFNTKGGNYKYFLILKSLNFISKIFEQNQIYSNIPLSIEKIVTNNMQHFKQDELFLILEKV